MRLRVGLLDTCNRVPDRRVGDACRKGGIVLWKINSPFKSPKKCNDDSVKIHASLTIIICLFNAKVSKKNILELCQSRLWS